MGEQVFICLNGLPFEVNNNNNNNKFSVPLYFINYKIHFDIDNNNFLRNSS